MKPTRVIYDGLPPGTHTWIFEEGAGEQAMCTDHGVIKTLKANADGSPRKELPKKCDQAALNFGVPGVAYMCGKATTRQPCITVTGRPDVFPNDVIEVADLNDPNSHRATMARQAIASGQARMLKDGETAPAMAPASTS